MGIAARRRNQKSGQASNVMIIPAGINVGEESSIAANRLLLADPKGKIDENTLLELLEEVLEPEFYRRKEAGDNGE